MAWEKRRSEVYFYKYVRLPDGRKVAEYCGRGPRAFVAALAIDRRELEKSQAMKVIRELRAATIEAEELAQIFHDGVAESLAAEMLIIGYHNPGSRGWRKIMQMDVAEHSVDCAEKARPEPGVHPFGGGPQSENASVPQSASEAEFARKAILNKAAVSRIQAPKKIREPRLAEGKNQGTAGAAPVNGRVSQNADGSGSSSRVEKSIDEMSEHELRDAAKVGNRAAMSRLRPMMDRNSKLHSALGCLSTKAKLKWFDAHYGQNLVERDCLRRNMQDLAADLLKDGNSPLERLLVDEVVLCVLRSRYWVVHETRSVGNDCNAMVSVFTVEQTSRAQKQLLKAMNALRDFRTLAGRRSVLTLPRVLEETAADNAARATEVDDLAGVQP